MDRVGLEPTTPGLSLEVNPSSCLLSRYIHLTHRKDFFRRDEEKIFVFLKLGKTAQKKKQGRAFLGSASGEVILYKKKVKNES